MTQSPSREELNRRIEELEEALRKKEREATFQASHELFEKTFRNQMDAIFILDAGIFPRIVDCNLAAEKMFGYLRNEMLDKTTEFLHIN